jgi:hypothetical protein
MSPIKNILFGSIAALAAATMMTAPAAAQQQKPNILIIWGDDIGTFNVSAYNMGMMGYRTPNIDSIAQAARLCHRPIATGVPERGNGTAADVLIDANGLIAFIIIEV